MKKDVKEINGKLVYLAKGDVCRKCVVFDNESGDCLSGDNTECMTKEGAGKVWKLAYPVREFFNRMKAFYERPFIKFITVCILTVLFFLFLLAGESILLYILEPLK